MSYGHELLCGGLATRVPTVRQWSKEYFGCVSSNLCALENAYVLGFSDQDAVGSGWIQWVTSSEVSGSLPRPLVVDCLQVGCWGSVSIKAQA